ncbi:uncharacterized protein LOC122370137 isoform X2 [Amphibalanus amphitrite]|uniref:uncharacterized protein LOC122370137 isoform X2 n=1 Tax=Amphibalanus amphitrite TaxID=1232801 RepID=UPI001C8FAC14|nr:uncharacterized protein LOC122370137 isoform X2 [Amphibalanus amphitrite]XP_043201378.1 uncharacterized protein LOC122370137 isoform X2 [Amphibalanus amphitrite]
MACLESSFYQDHRSPAHITPLPGALDCVDEELLRTYVACVDGDRCQRTQQLLAEDCELDWFGVLLQGRGRVMSFLQCELPVTHHEYSRAERVPHICRRVRKRAPARDEADGDDASLTAGLLALSLLAPPAGGGGGGGGTGHSRHSSMSAGSDSTFSLCSSYDSSQLEESEFGPMRLLRLSGALAFDGPWADRDTVEDGDATMPPPPPEAKWRRRMRLSLAYTSAPFRIHKIYYEENTKARRSLNF